MLKTQIKQTDILNNKARLFAEAQQVCHELRQDFLENLCQTVKREHTKRWLWWNNERHKMIVLTAIVCVQKMMVKL